MSANPKLIDTLGLEGKEVIWEHLFHRGRVMILDMFWFPELEKAGVDISLPKEKLKEHIKRDFPDMLIRGKEILEEFGLGDNHDFDLKPRPGLLPGEIQVILAP